MVGLTEGSGMATSLDPLMPVTTSTIYSTASSPYTTTIPTATTPASTTPSIFSSQTATVIGIVDIAVDLVIVLLLVAVLCLLIQLLRLHRRKKKLAEFEEEEGSHEGSHEGRYEVTEYPVERVEPKKVTQTSETGTQTLAGKLEQ